jgi:selenocysteine lyase/cysteine desulfurase
MTYRVPDVEHAVGEFGGKLWKAGVNVSVVTSQHAFWALESLGAQALLRLTPHYLTHESEIEQLAGALEALQLPD